MHRKNVCIASLRMTFIKKKITFSMNELQMLLFFINSNSLKVFRKFRLVPLSPGFMSAPLTYALINVPFYEYIPVVILFLLSIQL
jgi:hypothetical protein